MSFWDLMKNQENQTPEIILIEQKNPTETLLEMVTPGMGISSLMKISSTLIGELQNELLTGNYNDGLKNIYKKLMMLFAQATCSSVEESVFQLTIMRDSLSEIIDELKNGDGTSTE